MLTFFRFLKANLDIKKKLYLVILLKINKNSKINFYHTLLFLDLIIYFRIKVDE